MSSLETTAAACGLTILIYRVSLEVRRRWAGALTTPVFIAATGIIAVLAAFRFPVAQYEEGSRPVVFFLGAATAALAVPLYRHRAVVRAHARQLAAAICAGTCVTTGVALGLAQALHMPAAVRGALSVKSATAPVAVQLAPLLGIDPAIVVALVILTGVIGAMTGPGLLSALGVHDQVSRGAAIGAVSHGIGTAQCALESALTAASSTIAMCAAAALTSLAFAPVIRTFIH